MVRAANRLAGSLYLLRYLTSAAAAARRRTSTSSCLLSGYFCRRAWRRPVPAVVASRARLCASLDLVENCTVRIRSGSRQFIGRAIGFYILQDGGQTVRLTNLRQRNGKYSLSRSVFQC